MTIAVGRAQNERGLFDALDDWLKRDRFVFVGWSWDCCYFPAPTYRHRWLANRHHLRHILVHPRFGKLLPRRSQLHHRRSIHPSQQPRTLPAVLVGPGSTVGPNPLVSNSAGCGPSSPSTVPSL